MALLGMWHLILIALDKTTIEFYRHTVQPVLQGGAAKPKPRAFSKGSLTDNFRSVFFPTLEHIHSAPIQLEEPASELLVTSDGCVHRLRTEVATDTHV